MGLVLQRCATPSSQFDLALHVDTGEASAIAAAIELNCAVLMDDKAGRRMAKNLGVAAIGTVVVLVLAKQKGLIQAVKPCLDQLNRSGHFLGDSLIASALLATGESYRRLAYLGQALIPNQGKALVSNVSKFTTLNESAFMNALSAFCSVSAYSYHHTCQETFQ